MAETILSRRVTIAGQAFVLSSAEVLRAVRGVDPEPIASHFVVIGARRFPPKQVISALTGLDRADFTTHQARRTLVRLGFPAGRRTVGGHASGSQGGSASTVPETLPDRLRQLRGEWVAIKDQDVIHSARTPHALVAWLGEHGQKADSVFRVPDDDLAATGLAPL
jgi:hypothetical protein